MIAVDSSALVAILRREEEAERFLRILAAEDRCLVSTMSFLETSIVLAGRKGSAASWAELDAMIRSASMDLVDQDPAQAAEARTAFLRFGKGRHPAGLNFGDCASYALAKTRGLRLLFKGDDFGRTDLVPAAYPL